jgi:hypothetical protein
VRERWVAPIDPVKGDLVKGVGTGGVRERWVAPIDPVKGEWEEVKRLGLIGVGLQGKY